MSRTIHAPKGVLRVRIPAVTKPRRETGGEENLKWFEAYAGRWPLEWPRSPTLPGAEWGSPKAINKKNINAKILLQPLEKKIFEISYG